MFLSTTKTGLFLPLVLVIFLSAKPECAEGQEVISDNWGLSAGVSLSLGSTVNRLGIHIGSFYVEKHIQINPDLRVYWNLRSYGPRSSSKELQGSIGLTGAWGKNSGTYYRFLSPVSNQTGYDYAFSYAYKIYVTSNSSSQASGIVHTQIESIQVTHENDIFAGKGQDRFRTGAFLIAYQEEELRLGIAYIGWTGDPKTNQVIQVPESNYPSKRGYKDLRNSTYGRYSHGILAMQAETISDFDQIVRVNAGIDAEQIRHGIQNQFMHGMITRGVHYPMLDPEGNPYLYQEGQSIRPARPFYQGHLNPPLFY